MRVGRANRVVSGGVRILLATRVFPPDVLSGTATVVWNIWDRLRRAHDVRLVAGWQRDPSLLPTDAKAVRVEGSLRNRVAVEVAVRRAAMTFRPDVVLAHGLEVPPTLAATVGLLSDPYARDEAWGRLRGARRSLYRRRITKMAMPVVPSAAAKRRWADFGVPIERLRVAWPGVDTALFRPDDQGAPMPRTADDGPIRLLYAARIMPGKGQHVAIEAVKGLHDNIRRRVTLDLIGPVVDPAYHESLQRRAVGAPVTFHGSVSDLVPWYREAHIVLFPTVMEEAFGYSAVDGMACGKPVIFSKNTALLEVTDGIGVAVPAGDVKRLGEAIRMLVKDPDRCEELGRKGRALVVERYSWERAIERYEQLIGEAAARG